MSNKLFFCILVYNYIQTVYSDYFLADNIYKYPYKKYKQQLLIISIVLHKLKGPLLSFNCQLYSD